MMMMTICRFSFLIYCFVSLPFGLVAQELTTVHGIILDELAQPLSGAGFQILNGPGGLTDSEGRFTVSVVASDSITIAIRYLGYEPWSGSLDLPQIEALTIQLTPSSFALKQWN
ncbi:MAG: carboxypeptidase regulatory-like domain-containing protein [Saprospiraceae bacterium]|nr:carboxypeptidase regulatory-like domain-containing protein [Saprospiraceae bacterium]